MATSKAPSQRQLRVGEHVRHALTEVLTRETLEDPILSSQLISVTEVRMSADLKIATAFISPLGGRKKNGKGAADAQAICKALAKNMKFIRARATPYLNQMRYMPTFRFREDTSFENFAKIDRLLKSDAVQRDVREEMRPDIRKDDSK
ncbi:30S ribosome-binding factor RbfA [Pseudahrensia aquimaris]|uniref:Ribosome-binding factor A n=1 Tax=Pseudahrensia aquimaris TaxID=744461 RepID=A0ABW3FG20_9HYPH